MDRDSRLRISYAEMLRRAYSRKMDRASEAIEAFEEKLRDPRRTQEATLRAILERHASCEYGRKYDFPSIADSVEYAARVPIVTYEDLRPDVERMLQGEPDVLIRGVASYFSTTSGSTAAPKFIPGTQQTILAACEAILARNCYLRRDRPMAFAGRPLMIVGNSAEGKTAGGVGYGAMTGFGYQVGHMGFSAEPFPYEIFGLRDFAARSYCILRLALGAADLSSIFVYNPSTLLLLLETAPRLWDSLLADIAGGGLTDKIDVPLDLRRQLLPFLAADPERARQLQSLRALGPRAWWPSLAIVVCWTGGSLGFYLSELRRWIGDLPVRDLGLLASEGVVTVAIDDETPGAVLLPESGFFEFVPVSGPDQRPRGAWELEQGGEYRLLITTQGGLYRYDLADVVRVEGRHSAMPTLAFLHRAGGVHSFTGEKLTELQVSLAVRAAADGAGIRLAGFTAVPMWERPPYYEVRAELAPGPSSGDRGLFSSRIEEEIRTANCEYAGKRDSGRLGAARLTWVATGSFARRRASHVGSDAQYKESHLVHDALSVSDLPIADAAS